MADRAASRLLRARLSAQGLAGPPLGVGPDGPVAATRRGAHDAAVVSGGIFRGFALVRGRAAAVWRFAGSGIELEPLVAIDGSTRARLEHESAAVLRFLGR